MNTETLQTLSKKVGLKCNGVLGDGGLECSKGEGEGVKIKAKKNSSPFDVENISGGKIKVYKDETHNKGFKFVIENGDISGTDTNKLEQFETYEIKEEEKQWRLTKKTDAKEGIKKALGLEDDCNFPTSEGQDCDISGEKFKKVKFDGIAEADAGSPEGTKLKITSETNTQDYPFGYKFVLESANDAKISNSLTIGGNTNTEFKIKKKENSNDITLEKRWSLDELVKKVGLESCANATGSDSIKECSLKDGSINVFEEDNKKIEGAKVKNSTGDTKKLKVEENVADHSQGFKFYTEENNGIEICKDGQEGSPSVTKIDKKDSATYEIKEKTEGETTKWYLFKKTTATG